MILSAKAVRGRPIKLLCKRIKSFLIFITVSRVCEVNMFRQLAFLLLISACFNVGTKAKVANSRHGGRRFPEGFLFGTATSAYQIEGAWNEDGKSESIWDRLTHMNPSPIKDNSTGDIANDSYHLYKRDVEIMRELGVDFYRFSLAWTRILPTSFPDKINQAGVDYYNNLINELLKYNIKPMITLYHWDLPQKLQDMGGWTNPYIVDWYADYARTAFELFGDRVKYWITINEPELVCNLAYGHKRMAPQLEHTGVADYMCAKNLLMAHAKAYHIYDEEYRSSQNGYIFITLSSQWYDPATEEDVQAANDQLQFEIGQYAHPIFTKSGDWPSVMKERIAAKSAEQGFPRSRLPKFSTEEVKYLRGTSDLFGLNHYSTQYVYRNESVVNDVIPSRANDVDVAVYSVNEFSVYGSGFTNYAPRGFYKLLKFIKEEYNSPTVFVTENGFATFGGMSDDNRVTYYRGYLDAMLDAMDEGVDIMGYTAWSSMDNFEWPEGYIEKFGLYAVDYESPQRTRTPRKSAFVYKEILRTRTLDFNYEPDTTAMTIDEGH